MAAAFEGLVTAIRRTTAGIGTCCLALLLASSSSLSLLFTYSLLFSFIAGPNQGRASY